MQLRKDWEQIKQIKFNELKLFSLFERSKSFGLGGKIIF